MVSSPVAGYELEIKAVCAKRLFSWPCEYSTFIGSALVKAATFSLCCLVPQLFLYRVLFTKLLPMSHWHWLGATQEVITWKQPQLPTITLLPWSHKPSCDRQVPVRGLNFDPLKTQMTESRVAELLRLLTLAGWTPCLQDCENLWREWKMLSAVRAD